MNIADKKTVEYIHDEKEMYVVVGHPAFVTAFREDHSPNGVSCRTTEVLQFDKQTGFFETLNSVYVPRRIILG